MPYRSLQEELLLKSQEELIEVPSRISSDIAQIKEWVEKQPHLNARKDDHTILNFLRHAKFSLERTKEKLDAFYTARSTMPEFFENRDPFSPEIQEVLKKGIVTIVRDSSKLPVPSILIVRWGKRQSEEVSLLALSKVILMMMDIAMLEDESDVITGGHVVEDLYGFSFNYLSQVTPKLLKQGMILLQDAYPIRTTGIHVVNSPSFVEMLYKMIRPLMKEKLTKRFHIYGADGWERIKQDIPLSVLPNEYGGTAGTIEEIAAVWKKKLESYHEWFKEDGQYGTDETKRIGRRNSGDLSFGEEGSFRKLEVD